MFYYNYFRECRKNRKELSFFYSIRFLILVAMFAVLCVSCFFAYQKITIAKLEQAKQRIVQLVEGDEYVIAQYDASELRTNIKDAELEKAFFEELNRYLESRNIDYKVLIDNIYTEAKTLDISVTNISFSGIKSITISGSSKSTTALKAYMTNLNQTNLFVAKFPTISLEKIEGVDNYTFDMNLQIRGEDNEK